MSDSGLATLKGIVAKLKADGNVTALIGTRVYTYVPQKSTFPYIYLSLPAIDYSTKTSSGMEYSLRVQAFSRARSPEEVLNIRKAAYNSLNRNEINVTIAGFDLVSLQQSGAVDYFLEDDRKTWQAVLDFRIVVN